MLKKKPNEDAVRQEEHSEKIVLFLGNRLPRRDATDLFDQTSTGFDILRLFQPGLKSPQFSNPSLASANIALLFRHWHEYTSRYQ